MKIIFLDIDGVLNDHKFNKTAGCCTINPARMVLLNKILAATDACLVISSSWRYMVNAGSMTVHGFQNMLQTHGLSLDSTVIGTTVNDELIPERGDQILSWVSENNISDFVVLDDLSVILGDKQDRFVKVDGVVGLTTKDVSLAISILNKTA